MFTYAKMKTKKYDENKWEFKIEIITLHQKLEKQYGINVGTI